ncbi:hypothetical protein BJV74DRAFT_880894 [Russula compacta]|nr:hypothetical protein BJV74DRAFT_880894 [Russula compacta]
MEFTTQWVFIWSSSNFNSLRLIRKHASLNEQYSSWVKAYGPVKAASIAREHIQLWQQGRQLHPPVPFSTQSTIAQPTPSASAQNLQDRSQSQIPKQEEVAATPLPHPQTQEWHSLAHSPQQVTSSGTQPRPAVPSSHVPPLHPSTDGSTLETAISRTVLNTSEVHSHHLEATTSNPAVTSTDLTPTTSVLPSSQSSPTRSILLDPKEKGTALYTMHGLAASIKRSLNAERLAASAEPSASSDSHGQKRKRSSSAEAIDTLHEAESSRPNLATGKAYEQGPLPK